MRRLSQKGFTLTEALVAVAIFSGVVVSTAPILQTTLKSATRMSVDANFSEELRTANTAFRSRIETAVYPGATVKAHGFIGKRQSMTFLAMDRAQQDIRAVKLEFTGRSDDKVLRLSTITPSGAEKKETSAALIRSLISAQFSYYGTEGESGIYKWHDRWPGPNPPQLVAVEGTIERNRKQHRFRLEAAVGGAAPYICFFDPVSRSCRGEL